MKIKIYSLLISCFIVLTSFSLQAQNTTCLTPTATTTIAVTSNGATANWAANTTGSYYKVQYRPVALSNATWTQFYAQVPSYTFTGLTCGTAYEWQVQTICAAVGGVANTSAFSPSMLFTTLPCSSTCADPTNLQTTAIGQNSAVFSWTSTAPATTYSILQYRPVNTATWTSVTVTANTSYTVSSLVCNTTYEWNVKTMCSNSGTSGGSSNVINGSNFTTLACSTATCPIPTATATNLISTTSAQAIWAPTSGALAYQLQYRSANTTAWNTVTTQTASYTFTNLACATMYEWQVKSICSTSASGGMSAFTSSTTFTTLPCATVCPAPTTLTSTSVNTNSAVLSWLSPTGPSYFLIHYRPTGTSAWLSATVQGNSVYTLSNLVCNTTYEWEVQSICANSGTIGGSSSFVPGPSFTTAACQVNCLAPTNLTSGSITTNGAVLTWLAPAGAVYYNVRYRPTIPANSTWAQLTVTANTIATLNNLTCGTAYEWQVQTVCSAANSPSAYTASATFTTAPCTVTCVTPVTATTSNISQNGAIATWMAVSGVTTYNLQYRLVTNVVTNWTQTTVQGTSFTFSGLICNAMYEWQVASVCSNLNGTTILSAFSASKVFTTLTCPTTCPVPTGLTSGNVTSSSAYLGWTAQSGVVAYRIQYRIITPNVPPTSVWTQLTVPANTTTLANLICNSNYEWQVQSLCSTTAAGASAWSASAYFTTSACATTCAPPTGLFATNITPSSANVKWTASSFALTSQYAVRYRKLNTNVWTTVTATTNSKTLTGLAQQSYYEWQVQAMCPANNGTATGTWSAWSASAYFHTHFVVAITPNPADRLMKVEVKVEVDETEPVLLELRNILGAVVYRSEEKFYAGNNQFEIATANLAEGLYFLSISTSTENEIVKMYVKH